MGAALATVEHDLHTFTESNTPQESESWSNA
jgi:hypothetical protein